MRLLLDTQVWLWLQQDPQRLGDDLAVLQDDGTELLLSACSAWEIAIKHRLGKLTLPETPTTYVPTRMSASGVTPLAVEHSHALAVASLPDHHRDPFDRMLVAQAILERASLVTADPQLRAYDAELIWVGT